MGYGEDTSQPAARADEGDEDFKGEIMSSADLDRPSRTVRPWYVATVAGLASFVDGAALSVNGIALVIYQQSIGLTGAQVGLLTAAVTFGLAVGALVGGRAGDLYGRRKVFLVTMIVIVLGSLAPTFGTSFGVLFAGLALLGLGVGADLPVSLATVAEVATDKNRGAMLVFSQAMWVLASITVIIVATTTGDQGRISGQILYGMIALVGTIGFVMRLTIPESAAWIRSREQRRLGTELPGDQAAVRELFKAPFRRPLVVLSTYYALIGVAGNVAASFVAFIAVNVAGLSVTAFTGYTLLAMPTTLVGLAVMMKLVGTRARLPLFLAGGIVFAAGFLLPVVLGVNLLSLVLVVVLASAGSALCGEPMARVWANESFPTLLRSTGQGFVFTVGRVTVAVASALAPVLIAFSPSAFFIALSVAALAGVLIGYLGFRRGGIRNAFTGGTEVSSHDFKSVIS